MHYDINILSIENVYYRQESKWTRNDCKTRHYDAIVFFTEGEIENNFRQKTVVAKKGDLLFLPGNLPYSGKRHSERCSYYVIDFVSFHENQFEGLGAPCAFAASNYQRVLQRFESVFQLWNRPSIDTMLGLKEHFYALLRERFLGEEKEDAKACKNHILQFVESNICDPKLSVAKICEELYISDSQLRRTVYKLAGTSPNEYITAIRLKKAKEMLSTTNESIKDIAYACGFASPYYFSRVFSKSIGMSPSAYRICTAD